MKAFAILCLGLAAAVINLFVTGWAHDEALFSTESPQVVAAGYSMLGEAIVPWAGNHSLLLVTGGLPILLAAVGVWRRWTTGTIGTTLFAVELLVAFWCWLVVTLAHAPFKSG